MKSITYRAPAKVILSGEHSVVYGKPALIAGLGKYISVTISDSKTNNDHGKLTQSIVNTAKEYVQKAYPSITLTDCSVIVSSEIPLGRGLGSSASLAVAICAALLHFYTGEEPDKNVVNTLAYKAEKLVHGTPSGADNTTVCFGGLIFFRKEFEFLKTISQLNSKLPKNIEDHLLLIDTGKPKETTGEMVKMVRIFYNEHAEEAELLLNKIEKITKRMVVSVVKEDASTFKEAITENQIYLEKLGVVSQSTIDLLKSLKKYGTGKVTGAGGKTDGSGYILFFADNRIEAEQYLQQQNIPFINFVQDFHGVQNQKSS